MTTNPMSEHERHIAAAGGEAKNPSGEMKARPFARDDDRSWEGEEGNGERLSRGMSEAGHEARRYREMYEDDSDADGMLARGQERLSEAYGSGMEAARSAYDWAEDYGYDAARYARRHARTTRRSIEDYFEQNPLMVGAVGFGVGLILGALVPVARREQRLLRPLGRDMRQTARHYGADALRSMRREADRARENMEPSRSREERGGRGPRGGSRGGGERFADQARR